jgi:hypothetical protein
MRAIGHLAVLVLLVAGSTTGSSAQTTFSRDRAVVITEAPILLNPKATTPLRVAAAGTRLIAFEEQGGWLRVQFQDSQYGLRNGYIATRFVRIERAPRQPADLSVPQEPDSSPQTATPGAEEARPPLVRSGFWFNAGFGYGSLGCDTCAGERANGGSGGISMGGTVTDRLLLGGGTTGWYRSEDGVWLSAGTFDVRVRFYPGRTSGFFLNGGAGLGSVSIGTGPTAISETGLGAMVGLGWDLRVGRNVSLTPFWNGSAISTNSVNVNFGQVGIGVTVH